jgi:chemotaxis protein methyltransferase CheR
MPEGIHKHINLLKEQFAMDISVFDKPFLERVIKGRMAASSCNSIKDYLLYLEKVSGESSLLKGQLNNSFSEFFRNPLTFALIEQLVVPKLFNKHGKSQSKEIRIWSAGCSSGQEPYSLAMLLDSYKNSHSSCPGYQIFATDLSEDGLQLALKGEFDIKAIRNTKIEYVDRYFRQEGELYVLSQILKEQVNFSHYDLLDSDSSSPPESIYGDFDLVMCSNVLFYYQPEFQQFILRKISNSLKSGGFFITGEAETNIVSSYGAFRQFVSPAAIFIKN